MAKSSRTEKEKIIIMVLGILLLVIILILLKFYLLPKFFKSSSQITSGPVAPSEIYQPLPSIAKIREIINNPRLDEMQYYKPFPTGGTPGQPSSPGEEGPEAEGGLPSSLPVWGTFEVGRPNPFIPFAPEK